MSLAFWESTQRARRNKAYFCVWCRNDILPGHVYTRLYRSDFRGDTLHDKVMYEHVDPPCPPEDDIRIIALAEPERLAVALVSVFENRLVQKVLINGDVVTETEVVSVVRAMTAAPYADLFEGPDMEEDIPF